jgi:AbrB family looped-hinge helix DNA binding protein
MDARTKVSTRGQVVIPKGMRDAYQWEVGQELDVVDTGDGLLLKTRPASKAASWKDVVGCLNHLAKGKPVPTDEDMQAAVREMATQRYRRVAGK